MTNIEKINISFPTAYILNYLKLPSATWDIFIAAKFIQNNITAQNILEFINNNLKRKTTLKTVKLHLKKLYCLHYITYSKGEYHLLNQNYTNFNNFQKMNLKIQSNLYNIYFQITKESLNQFKTSKQKNFKLFIFQDLICQLYNSPVTKLQLNKHLKLKQNEIREIYKNFEGTHKNHYIIIKDSNSGTFNGTTHAISDGSINIKELINIPVKFSKYIKQQFFIKHLDNFKEKISNEYSKSQSSHRDRNKMLTYVDSADLEYNSNWKRENLFQKLSDIAFCHKWKNGKEFKTIKNDSIEKFKSRIPLLNKIYKKDTFMEYMTNGFVRPELFCKIA